MNDRQPLVPGSTPLAVGPRDRSAEGIALAAPHGDALYGVVGYAPGRDQRDAIVGLGHQVIREMARRRLPNQPLCGVLHQEDVQLWQLPYTMRPVGKAAIMQLRQTYGRRVPAVLVRVWQHVGPCP